ncbi:MAG: hypothetical protein WD176_04030 [Pirellulales bacterium]
MLRTLVRKGKWVLLEESAMALREMACRWLEANCPLAEVRQNFLEQYDGAVKNGFACSFVIGSNLTASAAPYLIHGVRNEFFAFQLTPQQARALNVEPNALRSWQCPPAMEVAVTETPIVWIDDVTVDHRDALDIYHPSHITGTVHYRTEKWLMQPMAVEMLYWLPGPSSSASYYHFHGLRPTENRLPFSFRNLACDTKPRDRRPRPLALFFQIWASEAPDAWKAGHATISASTIPAVPPARLPRANPWPALYTPPQHGSAPRPPATPFDDAFSPATPFAPPVTSPPAPAERGPFSEAHTGRHHRVSNIRAVLVDVV